MKTSIIFFILVLNISLVLSNQKVVNKKHVLYGQMAKKCPKENTGGVLIVIAHETDCDKFYVCIDGEKVLQLCPDGLHFDPKHGNCDWPDVVNCQLTSPRPSSTSATSKKPISTTPSPSKPTSQRPSSTAGTRPPSTERTSQRPSSTAGTRPPPTEGTSKKPSSTAGTRPPPTEATSKKPSSTAGTRPPPTEGTSKRPSSTAGTRPPSSEGTSKRPSSTAGTRPPSSEGTSKRPSSTAGTQPPSSEGTSQRPSSTSGTQSPSSEGTSQRPSSTAGTRPPPTEGTSKRPSSTAGTRPPSSKPTSQWPSSTQGTKPTTTQKPTTTEKPSRPTSCPKGETSIPVLLAHECICSKYYLCRRGEQVLKKCPVGLHFNPDDQDCELPEEAGCIKPTPTPPPSIPTDCPPLSGPEAVHIAHETNCSLFYTCTGEGGKIEQECPKGLYFNPKLQVCDWPYNVNCTNKPPISTSTRKPTSTTTKNPWKPTSTRKSWHIISKREVNSEYEGESSSEATTTTEAWQNSDTCIGECPPFDPQNYTIQLPNVRCDKFCKCSNGQAYVISCPPNLQYSVVLKVCTWPYEANCTGIGGISTTTTTAKPITSSKGPENSTSSEKPIITSSKKPEISSSSEKPKAEQPPSIFQRFLNLW